MNVLFWMEEYVRVMFFERDVESYKGMYGMVLLLVGSDDMLGVVLFVGFGVMWSGFGKFVIGILENVILLIVFVLFEVIYWCDGWKKVVDV